MANYNYKLKLPMQLKLLHMSVSLQDDHVGQL